MSQDSTLKFKDFEYEFGMFTKVTWNGEVIYDDTGDNEIGNLEKVCEDYGNRIVYDMKVNVVSYHHVELEINGETTEHVKLMNDCEKEYKKIEAYARESGWGCVNLGYNLQIDMDKRFEVSYSLEFYTPNLDVGYDLNGNITITPYITTHSAVNFEDNENVLYNEDLMTQLDCFNYAMEEAKKIKEKFSKVIIDTSSV